MIGRVILAILETATPAPRSALSDYPVQMIRIDRKGAFQTCTLREVY